jgi:hypothetical protein
MRFSRRSVALLLGSAALGVACGGGGLFAQPAKKGGGNKSKGGLKNGELEVVTAAAVSVYVDGTAATYYVDSGSYRTKKLSPGSHMLEIFNLLGEDVASGSVQIEGGKRTRYRYRSGGHLDDLGVEKIVAGDRAAEPAPIVVPEPVYVPEPVWEAPAATDASFELSTGASDEWGVILDGYSLARSPWTGNFVATWQSAGWHHLQITQWGTVVYDSSVELVAGQNTACAYGWGALDCRNGGASLR